MRNGKKKEPNIDKLTRKQLIKMCRGRGIAIGQFKAQIERLKSQSLDYLDYDRVVEQLAAKTDALTSLNVAYLNLLSTNEELLNDVEANDIVIIAQEKEANEQVAKIGQLNAAVADFKEAWHAAGARATKTEEHARELAEFFMLNMGQVMNTNKLIVMGLKSIEDKYKEE